MIIGACLNVNPANRPSCNQILNNPVVIRNTGESSLIER